MSVEHFKKVGSSIAYNIFEEANVVECFIEYASLGLDILAALKKHNIILSNEFMCEIIEKYKLNTDKKFWGIAKCHPDSTFNKEIGMKVARSKALMKYYKKRTKIMREITEEIDRAESCCEDALNYSWLSYLEHEKNYMDSLKDD